MGPHLVSRFRRDMSRIASSGDNLLTNFDSKFSKKVQRKFLTGIFKESSKNIFKKKSDKNSPGIKIKQSNKDFARKGKKLVNKNRRYSKDNKFIKGKDRQRGPSSLPRI